MKVVDRPTFCLAILSYFVLMLTGLVKLAIRHAYMCAQRLGSDGYRQVLVGLEAQRI